METIFSIMMMVTIGAFLVSVITALVGLFTKDIKQKNQLFAVSAKSTLILALAFVVGFGACLASI